LAAFVAESALCSTVMFLGFQEDVRPYLAAADIFVFPSRMRAEGLPFALIEAMSSGLACIATDVGGVQEAISDGVDGMIVPPESPSALAESIRSLFLDSELRSTIGKRARARVESAFKESESLAEIRGLLLGSEPLQ
jgi:glycosyltransferase involved in cell wall biosynthesis